MKLKNESILFGIYIEASDLIQVSDGNYEMWLGSTFEVKNYVRSETKGIKRRSTRSVVQDIIKLNSTTDGKVSILLMCDDAATNFDDSTAWGPSMYRIVTALKDEGIEPDITLYTGLADYDEVISRHFRRSDDISKYLELVAEAKIVYSKNKYLV